MPKKSLRGGPITSLPPRSIGTCVVEQWQRLPCTLLLDFTHRTNRAAPIYISHVVPTGFRVSVRVPDSKDKNHDSEFYAQQAMEDETDARNFAALTALMCLTPDMPLELKLPAMYRDAWINRENPRKNKKIMGHEIEIELGKEKEKDRKLEKKKEK